MQRLAFQDDLRQLFRDNNHEVFPFVGINFPDLCQVFLCPRELFPQLLFPFLGRLPVPFHGFDLLLSPDFFCQFVVPAL